jgi:hypothetical protein
VRKKKLSFFPCNKIKQIFLEIKANGTVNNKISKQNPSLVRCGFQDILVRDLGLVATIVKTFK